MSDCQHSSASKQERLTQHRPTGLAVNRRYPITALTDTCRKKILTPFLKEFFRLPNWLAPTTTMKGLQLEDHQMRTRNRARSRKSGATAMHWLMFALSFFTIAWISFPTTGG